MSGPIVFSTETWIATRNNALEHNITEYVESGSVDFNINRSVKRQGTLTLRREGEALELEPYRDYIAPFVVTTQGGVTNRQQLGLYAVRTPKGFRRAALNLEEYTLLDLTWELQTSGFSAPFTMTGGELYVDEIAAAIDAAGITRYFLPASSLTVPADRTFKPGSNTLEVVNQGLQAIAAYTAYTDGEGRIGSQFTLPIQSVQPLATLTNSDIQGGITDEPPARDPINVVILVMDRPNEPMLVGVARNDEVNSPTSTGVNGLGREIVRFETVNDVSDQDSIDALAESLLREGRSYYQTATVHIKPGIAFTGRDTLDFAFSGDLAVHNGRWWVRTWSYGLSVRDSVVKVGVNRTTDTWKGLTI